MADSGRGDKLDQRESIHAAHGHAAAWRKESGIHLHDPIQSAGQGQPGGVDGRSDGWRQLWQAVRLQLPQAESGLRAAADRQPDQSGHRHLPAADAVGSARLAGHSRGATGDPNRGISHLCAADLPARRGRQHPRVEARGRRSREQSRDGRDSRGRTQCAVWCGRSTASYRRRGLG